MMNHLRLFKLIPLDSTHPKLLFDMCLLFLWRFFVPLYFIGVGRTMGRTCLRPTKCFFHSLITKLVFSPLISLVLLLISTTRLQQLYSISLLYGSRNFFHGHWSFQSTPPHTLPQSVGGVDYAIRDWGESRFISGALVCENKCASPKYICFLYPEPCKSCCAAPYFHPHGWIERKIGETSQKVHIISSSTKFRLSNDTPFIQIDTPPSRQTHRDRIFGFCRPEISATFHTTPLCQALFECLNFALSFDCLVFLLCFYSTVLFCLISLFLPLHHDPFCVTSSLSSWSKIICVFIFSTHARQRFLWCFNREFIHMLCVNIVSLKVAPYSVFSPYDTHAFFV